MRGPGQPDCLQVINGPEDGAEYPLVRSPLYLGQDPRCQVPITLDRLVEERQVEITVVSEGYRVRQVASGATLVNGKRVGRFFSRVLRDGGTLQAGSTLLLLECSPDGMACRSRGLAAESDLGWMARNIAGTVTHLGRIAMKTGAHLVMRILSSKLAIVGVLALLYFGWPAFRDFVNAFAYNLYGTVYWFIMTHFGGFFASSQ